MAEEFLKYLETLSDEQRNDALGKIFEAYCQYCYDPQPLYGFCQCWNDE